MISFCDRKRGWLKRKTIGSLLALGLAAGCGGSDANSPTAGLDQTETVELDAGDFDGVTPLRAEVAGLQLSVAPQLAAAADGGWVLALEADRPLHTVLAWAATGELGRMARLDAYRYELALDRGELELLLAGEPLYLTLQLERGQRRSFAALIELAPRFVEPGGSMLIWLHPAMQQVATSAGPRLRGRATAAERIERLQVHAAGAGEPRRFGRDDADGWWFEYGPADLCRALSAPDAGIELHGRSSDGRQHQVRAGLTVATTRLGLTTGEPETTWPAGR